MVRVLVSGSDDNEPLVACAVAIGDHSLQTDLDGLAWINLNTGTYPVKAAYVGYRPWQSTLRLAAGASDTTLVIRLEPDQIALKEITISAKESTGMTSASRIDRGAMAHLQPSSFTDLLELLPGNISQNPDMGQVNSIKLRETGNIGATGTISDNADYAMSALGTLFNVDGAPVATDANLQSTGIEAATGRNAVNRGVDMRSLSTDNIESVEIVRGIPSAEYGNLTSGMVDIRRTRRATPFTARFKADGYSKLLLPAKVLQSGRTPSISMPGISTARSIRATTSKTTNASRPRPAPHFTSSGPTCSPTGTSPLTSPVPSTAPKPTPTCRSSKSTNINRTRAAMPSPRPSRSTFPR